jgi:hypothetical protein
MRANDSHCDESQPDTITARRDTSSAVHANESEFSGFVAPTIRELGVLTDLTAGMQGCSCGCGGGS